jgi:hypothetical protein
MKLRQLRYRLRQKLRLEPLLALKSYAATPFFSRVYAHMRTCAHARAHIHNLCRSFRILSSLLGSMRSFNVLCRSFCRSFSFQGV